MSASALDVTLSAYRKVLENPEVLPDDDFFELGGDSMLAIDAVSMIEEEVGMEIPATWFFTFTTPVELASAITDAEVT